MVTSVDKGVVDRPSNHTFKPQSRGRTGYTRANPGSGNTATLTLAHSSGSQERVTPRFTPARFASTPQNIDVFDGTRMSVPRIGRRSGSASPQQSNPMVTCNDAPPSYISIASTKKRVETAITVPRKTPITEAPAPAAERGKKCTNVATRSTSARTDTYVFNSPKNGVQPKVDPVSGRGKPFDRYTPRRSISPRVNELGPPAAMRSPSPQDKARFKNTKSFNPSMQGVLVLTDPPAGSQNKGYRTVAPWLK